VSERPRTWPAIVAVLLAVALVLGGQALADADAPSVPNGALTGQAVGRAGFAYLTGLREFAAALLWNRLEQQMHEYYGGDAAGLGRYTFMLPSIKIITILDPQFIEGYYVAPLILIVNGQLPGTPASVARQRTADGLALAKEGVTNNPKSGVLLASYAQILLTVEKNVPAALAIADRGMAKDIVWRYDDEEFDSMAIFAAVFHKAGEPQKEAAANAIKAAISANPHATTQPQV
jgi:hypothetical protein